MRRITENDVPAKPQKPRCDECQAEVEKCVQFVRLIPQPNATPGETSNAVVSVKVCLKCLKAAVTLANS